MIIIIIIGELAAHLSATRPSPAAAAFRVLAKAAETGELAAHLEGARAKLQERPPSSEASGEPRREASKALQDPFEQLQGVGAAEARQESPGAARESGAAGCAPAARLQEVLERACLSGQLEAYHIV